MSWVRVPLVTLKKEAVSNETKRYSLYFGMTGMSMVPAEINWVVLGGASEKMYPLHHVRTQEAQSFRLYKCGSGQ